MSDLISRQAAIDAIQAINSEGDSGINSVLGIIEMKIIDLPSAGPQWIPCSERLPKELVPVNITWVNREPMPYYEHIKNIPFSASGLRYDGSWYWYSCRVEDELGEYGHSFMDSVSDDIEIIAWMPLPEPY